MMTVSKVRKDYFSYVLICVWIVAFLNIKSVPLLFVIAVILSSLSVYSSFTYYKNLKGASKKEDYIRKKLVLFATTLGGSILCLFWL